MVQPRFNAGEIMVVSWTPTIASGQAPDTGVRVRLIGLCRTTRPPPRRVIPSSSSNSITFRLHRTQTYHGDLICDHRERICYCCSRHNCRSINREDEGGRGQNQDTQSTSAHGILWRAWYVVVPLNTTNNI